MSSFNHDLDYYGLVPEEGAIKHACISDVLASLQNGKSKYDMFCLAVETHHQYVFGNARSTGKKYVWIDFKKMDGNLVKDRVLSQEEREMFLDYLNVYFGLRMTRTTESRHPTGIVALASANNFYVIKK